MEPFSVDESRRVWEANAAFWDGSMGDESNRFHREVVRPGVNQLLNVRPGEYILEIILPKWIQEIGKIKKCAFAV